MDLLATLTFLFWGLSPSPQSWLQARSNSASWGVGLEGEYSNTAHAQRMHMLYDGSHYTVWMACFVLVLGLGLIKRLVCPVWWQDGQYSCAPNKKGTDPLR